MSPVLRAKRDMSFKILTCITVVEGDGLPQRAFLAIEIPGEALPGLVEESEFQTGEKLSDEAILKEAATNFASAALKGRGYTVLSADPGQCHFENAEKFEEITAAAQILKRAPNSVWLRQTLPG